MDSIYVVLIISLVVWLGVATYLFFLDVKIGKIEKKIAEREMFRE